jgi:outer membrane protein assembly factor BamB
VLVGSPLRVVALDAVDGSEAWRFEPDRAGAAVVGRDPFARREAGADTRVGATGRLHGFALGGGRLHLMQGDRALMALGLEDGRPAWSYAPEPSERGDGAEAAINPHFLVTRDAVVAQVGGNRSVVVLDAESGGVRTTLPRPGDDGPWMAVPHAAGPGRVVLTLDPRTVCLVDLERGVEVWTHKDAGSLPRTGSPRVFGGEGGLLVLFGGTTLERLDVATGEAVWTAGLGLDGLRDAEAAVAVDGERAYLVSEGRLRALGLKDGREAWSRPVPDAGQGWLVSLRGDCVVAWPDPEVGGGDPLASLPVAVHRRGDGSPVQRITLGGPAARVALHLGADGALVATQSEMWSLRRGGTVP